MNPYRHFIGEIVAALQSMQAAGELPEKLDFSAITAEPPRDPAHGDIATNAAMVLSRAAGKKPRDIAEPLLARLKANPDVVDGAVAGPGFLNLKIADGFWRARLADCLKAGIAYGDSTMGKGAKVNVEYVSANPTGPLHVAHARGAIVGDALSNLLHKAGYDVIKEYYINDAGAQVDKLGQSTYLRYREALGEAIDSIPEGLYPGEYLKDVGAAIAGRDGARWIGKPEADWLPEMRAFAIAMLMAEIKADLETLGVHIDVFSSERALVESGAVDRAFEELTKQGLIYQGRLEPPKGQIPDDWEDREQTLFRATQFGDEVDRPLKKSDGSWTYFANDIAYHHDKYRRGFADMIDVWGADHGGYIKRMKAAVSAITGKQGEYKGKPEHTRAYVLGVAEEARKIHYQETEPRGIFVNVNPAFTRRLAKLVKRHRLYSTSLLGAAALEASASGIPTDASFTFVAGVPTVSLVSGPLYLYDDADTIDRIDVDQLEPVARFFADVIADAEAHNGATIGVLPTAVRRLLPRGKW